MVDKVKPLKFEDAVSGTEFDMFPTEVDPSEDYVSGKGFSFENSDGHLIDRDGSGRIQFSDSEQATAFPFSRLVKDFGTPANSLAASTQAAVNGIKTLVLTSNTDQIFTGATIGQIVRMPDATTLTVGHKFEIWNLTSTTIDVENSGEVLLTTLNPNARTTCILTDNSTANGIWTLTYTLDNGNVFGTQAYYEEELTETSTNSTTVFLNKVTLLTPILPFGDYLISWQFIWRAQNVNRSLAVRIQRGGMDIALWQPYTGDTDDRQLLSGFRRVQSISGIQSFTLDFRVNGTGTTVFMQQASMIAWRIA